MTEPENSLQLPTLDLSQPLHSALSSLCEACQEWGFFNIINHGISKHLLTNLYSLSKHLFTLPMESKQKLGPSSTLKTYTPHFIASPFFESLRVSGPDFFASAKGSIDILLSDPPYLEFCDLLEEYCTGMTELSKRVMGIVLRCLGDGFEKKFSKSEFGCCQGYLRIVHYTPPINVENEEVEGLGMHTDMSCITILNQDEIGGLQVRSKEGKWMDIKPKEGTLVVNIGDLLQAWSNGRLRSSAHRVVLKHSVTRLSLAFFWCFEDDKVIWAPEEVLGEGKERLYLKFFCSDYVKFRENSERGRFDKVGYTVDDFASIVTSELIEPPDDS
ncbi:gibberellin 20-oxidase-like protein [Aristolochia californica]|uniref:gibberellin 20-oxidase-like protein n=1 Tax=Aristolochia californica TaxID=171875 RepID=UPI0035E1424A